MIGLIIKLLLSGGSLFLTSYFFYDGSWGWGITFIFVTALFIFSIFRNENIILALNQMRMNNKEKAAARLDKIKHPQYLIKGQRAYYWYLRGLMGSDQSKMSETEKNLRKALSIGLRNKQDQAVAKMNIGAICINTGRRKEGLIMLDEAKKLDDKNMLDVYIKELKKNASKTASKNQMRMAQMSGGRKGPKKGMR